MIFQGSGPREISFPKNHQNHRSPRPGDERNGPLYKSVSTEFFADSLWRVFSNGLQQQFPASVGEEWFQRVFYRTVKGKFKAAFRARNPPFAFMWSLSELLSLIPCGFTDNLVQTSHLAMFGGRKAIIYLASCNLLG